MLYSRLYQQLQALRTEEIVSADSINAHADVIKQERDSSSEIFFCKVSGIVLGSESKLGN